MALWYKILFTLNSKNSVTISVEPFRVITFAVETLIRSGRDEVRRQQIVRFLKQEDHISIFSFLISTNIFLMMGDGGESYHRQRRESWGMFMSEEDDDGDDDAQDGSTRMSVRDAWQLITSNLGRHNYGVIPHKRSKVKQCLIKWRNPNPSVSVKHISNALSAEFSGHNALESSCFVDGFRIVQSFSGEVFAEFCLIFAYGSRSFLNWKSYSEFSEYLKILRDVHSVQPVFPQTLGHWEELQKQKKWSRCLSVPYLIKKSILLSLVAQSSFLECPTPALLLEFVQHKE